MHAGQPRAATSSADTLSPSGSGHDAASLSRGGLHAAALAVVAHAEVVPDFVSHGGGGSDRQVRVVLVQRRGGTKTASGPPPSRLGRAARPGKGADATWLRRAGIVSPMVRKAEDARGTSRLVSAWDPSSEGHGEPRCGTEPESEIRACAPVSRFGPRASRDVVSDLESGFSPL